MKKFLKNVGLVCVWILATPVIFVVGVIVGIFMGIYVFMSSIISCVGTFWEVFEFRDDSKLEKKIKKEQPGVMEAMHDSRKDTDGDK